MILTAINNKTFYESYDTRLEELEAFQQKCDIWEITARETVNSDDPGISAVFKKTDRSMTTRIIGGTVGDVYTNTTVVVTIVDDAGLIGKEWFWNDKIVENSQGGTTHLNGWHLS